MISFAKWQQLNENLGYTLGLRPVQSLGVMGAHTHVEDGEGTIEEAKKKKMLAGGDDMGAVDDSGDGETVPPASKKDVPSSDDFPKKGGGDDADEGNDDEEEVNDRGLNPKMFSKKKMSKGGDCSVCGSDPCKCPKKGSKKKNEWIENFKKDLLSDLKGQLGQGRNEYSDGWDEFKEDALLLAFGQQDDEVSPGPGEIGYAPTGRIGEVTPTEAPELDTLGESVKKK